MRHNYLWESPSQKKARRKYMMKRIGWALLYDGLTILFIIAMLYSIGVAGLLLVA